MDKDAWEKLSPKEQKARLDAIAQREIDALTPKEEPLEIDTEYKIQSLHERIVKLEASAICLNSFEEHMVQQSPISKIENDPSQIRKELHYLKSRVENNYILFQQIQNEFRRFKNSLMSKEKAKSGLNKTRIGLYCNECYRVDATKEYPRHDLKEELVCPFCGHDGRAWPVEIQLPSSPIELNSDDKKKG